MCLGTDCPWKNKCYRYRAIPSYPQWYIDPPIEEGECAAFISIGNKKDIRKVSDIEEKCND